MGIKDDFVQAVDSMIQSPFVRKINGIAVSDDWGPSRIQRVTRTFDDGIAKEIYKSSYMLSDLTKELEHAKKIITAAGQEAPEQCMQALKEHLGDTSGMQKELDAAQRELDALPKVDEAFMEVCRAKERAIAEEREEAKKRVEESEGKLQQAHAAEMRNAKGMLIASPFLILIGLTGFFISNQTLTAVLSLVMICGFFLLLISLIMIPLQSARYKSKLSEANKERQRRFAGIDKQYDDQIAVLRGQMEKGYDTGSDLWLKREGAKLKITHIKEKYQARAEIAENFEAVLQNPFQEAPPLLQRTIESMDSLVAWAANYMRDEETWRHNERMQSIEQKKLRDQAAASREQNDLLRKQADAAQAAARYAKEQAAAAKQQAKDTAEIKWRIGNERYGEYRK